MITFKQKVQVLNRVTIPLEIMQALQIKQGDEVKIACDEDQGIVYLLFNKKEMHPSFDQIPFFDRETGMTIPKINITTSGYSQITKIPYKKITNPEGKNATNKPKTQTNE